jgi:hypothetical protein
MFDAKECMLTQAGKPRIHMLLRLTGGLNPEKHRVVTVFSIPLREVNFFTAENI